MINKMFASLGRGFTKTEKLLDPCLDTFITSRVVGAAIANKKPFLASRLGFTEARCLAKSEETGIPSSHVMELIWRYSGVFPLDAKEYMNFSIKYLRALQSVDLLGLIRTQPETILVEKYAQNALTTDLGSLEPYLCSTPWSKHLKGKRVVVIHPFSESILSQYREHREKLFLDPNVLPQFELRLVRAPQTIAGNSDGFSSWSHALEHLIHETEREAYDVAILGCGAYGLPLGAYIKESGKVAIHLGGATQLLFGVYGKRWREHPTFRAIMNEFWCPPLESERPPGWERVEEGCYW